MKKIQGNEEPKAENNAIEITGSGNQVFQGITGSTITIGNGVAKKKKEKILFVASSPSDLTRIRTDRESREIREGLKRANNRDTFDFEMRLATRAIDLGRANPYFPAARIINPL